MEFYYKKKKSTTDALIIVSNLFQTEIFKNSNKQLLLVAVLMVALQLKLQIEKVD